MNVETDGWKGISIGDGVCINQYCHLDGRGGLEIHDNVSISIYTKILTLTHNKDDEKFSTKGKKVILYDRVWTGMNSLILPGTVMMQGSILAAGSVAIGKEYDAYKVYSGVPAKYICDRNSGIDYDLSGWHPIFR